MKMALPFAEFVNPMKKQCETTTQSEPLWRLVMLAFFNSLHSEAERMALKREKAII
jgi:hypothetical protein